MVPNITDSASAKYGSTRCALLLTAWLAALGALGCGPFLLISGGELEGHVVGAPSSWDFAEEISTVELETRPSDPYSVNIWATGVGNALYIHGGASRANWVDHIEADPDVRVAIEGKLYPLRATRVEDAAEFRQFSDAYENKYGTRPRNEVVAEVYLFRLESR